MTDSLPFGQKVRLQPLVESDRDLFVALATNVDVMQFVGEPSTVEDAHKDFDKRPTQWSNDTENWFMLGVADSQSGEVYGDVAIKMIDVDAKKAEIGFMLKPGAQGKGFGTEALGLLIGYAFEVLELNKLVAYVEVANIASFKALEKCGLKREGELKQNAFINGKFVDDYVYGLCRCDF